MHQIFIYEWCSAVPLIFHVLHISLLFSLPSPRENAASRQDRDSEWFNSRILQFYCQISWYSLVLQKDVIFVKIDNYNENIILHYWCITNILTTYWQCNAIFYHCAVMTEFHVFSFYTNMLKSCHKWFAVRTRFLLTSRYAPEVVQPRPRRNVSWYEVSYKLNGRRYAASGTQLLRWGQHPQLMPTEPEHGLAARKPDINTAELFTVQCLRHVEFLFKTLLRRRQRPA